MKRPVLLSFAILLAAHGFGQPVARGFGQPMAQSFPPSGPANVPTYTNGEIVGLDRQRVTIRSESGDTILTVDRRDLPAVSSFRRGDKVIFAYQTVVDEDGRTRRAITYLAPASPTSGQPGMTPASVRAATSGTGRAIVRVVSTDRTNRTITVADTSGQPVVLPVSARAARHLGQLRAGDVIGVGFAGGGVVSASAVPAVNTIAALPANTPLGSFVLPPVTGRFVRFDAGTNMVTVQTPGGQRSFPVTGTAAQGLSGLSPGDNLSLDFRVTQEFNQTRANASLARGAATPTSTVTQAAGTGASAPVLAVNNVQAATGQTPIQSAIGGPGASRVAPNTASINAPGLSAATGATGPTAVGGTGLAAATGTAGGAGTGTPAAPGLATPGTFSQMTGPFTGGIAIPNAVPGSPFANPVPSLPGPTPMLNVVLPPAIAKAPMSNEEVGLMRGQGERDLDSAAMVLAMQANEIDALWFRYKNACLGGFTSETTQAGREWFLLLEGRVRTPNDDGCRALFNQLQGMALGFREQMDIALEAARRADVLPGIVRQILERHRIER